MREGYLVGFSFLLLGITLAIASVPAYEEDLGQAANFFGIASAGIGLLIVLATFFTGGTSGHPSAGRAQ